MHSSRSEAYRRVKDAVKKAEKRVSEDRRSRIESLPVELQLGIIAKLTDIQSILNFSLTGPELWKLTTKNRAWIAQETVVSQIGEDIMPFAAALFELESLGPRLPKVFHKHRDFDRTIDGFDTIIPILDRHIGRDRIRNWKTQSKITYFAIAHKYLKLYNCIDAWAQILACQALHRVAPCHLKSQLTPAKTEMHRFRKALYLFQLVSIAFPVEQEALSTDGHSEAWDRLCKQVSPWERQQVRTLPLLLWTAIPCHKYVGVGGFQNDQRLPWFYSVMLHRGLPDLLALSRSQAVDKGYSELELPLWLARARGWGIRRYAFDERLDIDEFQYDETGSYTDLFAGEIFERYPEKDRGPKAWWYSQFLNLYGGFPTGLSEVKNICHTCIPLFGLVFWDFETLRMLDDGVQLREPEFLLKWTTERARSYERLKVRELIDRHVQAAVGQCGCRGTFAGQCWNHW
ncbi:hypothetical protein F5Y01DRAFT_318847 [Xylaria sp. FL0043]|nr:hypothetical protein F5Y01DRAFT_318847 [Xylaria sp. FL0043]